MAVGLAGHTGKAVDTSGFLCGSYYDLLPPGKRSKILLKLPNAV